VEAAFGLSCESRAEVDALVVAKAVAGGAKEMGPPEDHGFMYGRSFEDLDGHHWEVQWMNPNAAP
jgi:predicted lactoylglutathione lyase